MSQTSPLREQLKALENLQEIDLKIDSLKKSRNALPAALKTTDENLAKTRTACEAKQKALSDIDKNQKQTHAAQELNRDRLTRANSKLEGVQNSQEFQAANKEIDQLKKLSGNLEEHSKKAAGEIDALSKDVAALTAQMDTLKAEREKQVGEISSQTAKFDSEIASLTKDRAQYTSKVDTRVLAQYDRVRTARAGLGIAPAVGGRCRGCNMMVPPQLFIEIQRANQLHQCPSCHRILFVSEPSQPQPTA